MARVRSRGECDWGFDVSCDDEAKQSRLFILLLLLDICILVCHSPYFFFIIHDLHKSWMNPSMYR